MPNSYYARCANTKPNSFCMPDVPLANFFKFEFGTIANTKRYRIQMNVIFCGCIFNELLFMLLLLLRDGKYLMNNKKQKDNTFSYFDRPK